MAKKTDPLTPNDLIQSVFHGNKEALLRSVGRTARTKREQRLAKDRKAGKLLKRHLKRGDRGKVILEEETATPKKPKRSTTKKAKKG